MAGSYLNYIGMDSWPRSKETKMSNYFVWRFVELLKRLFNVPGLACILAPVLINDLDVSWGIDTIWPRIFFSS